MASFLLSLLLTLGQVATDPAEHFLRRHGADGAPRQYREALSTFLEVEELTFRGDHRAADRLLGELWRRYPVGDPSWQALPGKLAGLNIGSPPCYYALRMLTDITRWRLATRTRTRRPGEGAEDLRLTVVLVGEGQGIEPATPEQLRMGEGEPVLRNLDPRLLVEDHAVVHEALTLFREYVVLATEGRLGLAVDVHELPELRVALDARERDGRRFAGISTPAPVFAALPPEVVGATDWWWILYPGHVPTGAPFAGQEFVTGGMGVGPDGRSPLFLCDDLWLLRKPPHLGEGEMTSVERRAYLPQWLQHEFFHHLFRTYPGFELEARSHQWFDRSSWPEDFEGRYEPDYYHEALFRRLATARPPLHVSLRHALVGRGLERLRLRDLEGSYVREPVENDWHRGEIRLTSGRDLQWRNAAGRSWSLEPDLASGRLLTGPDCPYHDPATRNPFVLVPARDEDGRLRGIEGFRFGGQLYSRR